MRGDRCAPWEQELEVVSTRLLRQGEPEADYEYHRVVARWPPPPFDGDDYVIELHFTIPAGDAPRLGDRWRVVLEKVSN